MRFLAIYLTLTVSLCALLDARTWTNTEGQTMEASYSGTLENGGETVVVFVKSDGVRYQFPLKQLSAADQLYISSGKAAEEAGGTAQAAPTAPATAAARAKTLFEQEIALDLVRMAGRRLSPVGDDEIGPKDYYAIYYSAVWCPPCRAFTPKLVDFYRRQQRRNGDKFEIIFVSSDRDEEAMAGYMRDYKMPWPALKYSKPRARGGLNQYSARGIPCLVIVDKNGDVISHSYEGDKYVGPTKVLEDLAALLKD